MIRIGQEILQENGGHEWAGFDAGWTDCTCGKTVADLKEHIARTHENNSNPRFADTEILDFRTNARKGNK
jgi:hypothetical protein